MLRRSFAASALLAGSLALGAAGFVLEFLARGTPFPDAPSGFVTAATAVFIACSLVGALILRKRPGHRVGWIFLVAGFFGTLWGFSRPYAIYGLVTRPGSLPMARYLAWLESWVGFLGVLLVAVFLPLLFPNGELPSPRWRVVAWLGAVEIGLFVLSSFAPGNVQDVPVRNPLGIPGFGFLPRDFGPAGLGFLMLPIAMAAAAAGLVVRYRRSGGEEREQIKWLAMAAVLMAAAMVVNVFTPERPGGGGAAAWTFGLIAVSFATIPVAAGIAILRYRLYDIDLVINKTVVYAALAAFITAVYVGIVVGIGVAIGQGDRPNLGLSILATAVVAVAFQPVRVRVQRLANRLVYGKRASPYEILSHFADQMASTYAADELLPEMARILAEGTGASRAEVWLAVGRELTAEAAWPEGDGPRQALDIRGEELPPVPGADLAVPVRDRGELLGALSIEKPRGEPPTPTERKLLSDLASQAGLVLRNVKLIEELRASRQRIVSAQDQERRRLERNIHDGAQQQLVALNVKLGLARALARQDLERTEQLLTQLQGETREALENLRDLARGIYPPLLADQGLLPALQAQARKATLPVRVEAEGIGRYPQEAEAAVYFSVLEALQNVAKYAKASQAVVHLSAGDGQLAFEVSDDGVGFDPEEISYGTGLQGMADRLEAAGGSLEVESRPGAGTRVEGRVKVAPRVRSS
jgi:signal transduction histidine kinase